MADITMKNIEAVVVKTVGKEGRVQGLTKYIGRRVHILVEENTDEN